MLLRYEVDELIVISGTLENELIEIVIKTEDKNNTLIDLSVHQHGMIYVYGKGKINQTISRYMPLG